MEQQPQVYQQLHLFHQLQLRVKTQKNVCLRVFIVEITANNDLKLFGNMI